MIISHKSAVAIGITAIVTILVQQAFNSFSCYMHSVTSFLTVAGVFLVVPLLPALFSLVTANPLRAVGACLLLSPWLGLAYYTDCVRSYMGGGASMIYVAVLLWGTPCSLMGALLTGPVLRFVDIKVGER